MSGWGSDSSYYASSVSRDGFSYDGTTFSVKIDYHHHPRCDSDSLYRLLTWTDPGPVLTKAGKVAKKQPPPHKDNPLHFYEAQCLHYGLKQYKTRPAAKKHLLEAFNPKTKTLEVPKRILDLEKALKEEYRIANEAAMKKAHEEWEREEVRRRAWEKQREIELEKEQKKRKEEVEGMIKEFAAAGIVIAKGKVSELKSRTTKTPISDLQVRKDLGALTETQLRALVEKLLFDKRSPTFKKAAVKEMRAMKEEQAFKASQAAKTKGKGKGNTPKRLNDKGDDRGEYIIMAPYLREQWSDITNEMSLKMSTSQGSSHLWVWFNFGIFSGIMRSYGALPKHVGDTTELHWKGRDEGTGETCFGDDNVASITFLGDGRIRGRVRCPWAGTVEFIGKKQHRQNVVWVKSVAAWKREYREINERAYEAANQSRWGGWCDPGSEKDWTSNSDTDSHDGDLDECEENFYGRISEAW
ncbi:hypothetical protein H2248_006891 [Termitomyces sp. 'cryptogamus']|nr:hypothetical protein H2248_006891 [Termitomyces sp. 'cryptogamus']